MEKVVAVGGTPATAAAACGQSLRCDGPAAVAAGPGRNPMKLTFDGTPPAAADVGGMWYCTAGPILCQFASPQHGHLAGWTDPFIGSTIMGDAPAAPAPEPGFDPGGGGLR